MWGHIFLFGSVLRWRPSEFTAIFMLEFWREATAAVVPGLLCQCGRRRPETAPYYLKLQLRQTRLWSSFFLIPQKLILFFALYIIIVLYVDSTKIPR